MARRSDITVMADGVTPEPGIYITVRNLDGTLATLTEDNGAALANPLISGAGGEFHYNVTDGSYVEEFRVSLSQMPRTINAVQVDSVVSATTSAATATAKAAIATTQAGIATTQAGIATTQAGIATTKAAQTTTDATQTGLYAGLAATLLTHNLYPTTAAGIAGVADGEAFAVQGASGGTVYAQGYRRSGAAATDLGIALPSLLALTNALNYFDPDGSLKYVTGLADPNGVLVKAVDASGNAVTSGIPASSVQRRGTYRGTLSFDLCYGQSEAVGQAAPALSTQARYTSIKMFAGGMRPQYDHAGDSDATNYGTIVSAAETTSTVNPLLGETFCTAAAEAVLDLIETEDGVRETDHDYRLLVSAPGYGATSIEGLSKGTAHYTRMMTQITSGKAIEDAAKGRFDIGALLFFHGVSSSGSTQTAYRASLLQLWNDFNTDAKALLGRTADIPWVIGQLASHKNTVSGATPMIALAQLAACLADPAKFYMAGPAYQFEYQAGGTDVHLRNYGEKGLANLLGFVRKRVVNDGIAWKPVSPTGVVTSYGSTSRVFKFNVPTDRYGNPDYLVWDTTNIVANTNYGIEAVTSGGALLTQGVPRIVDRDEVLVDVPGGWPAGARLQGAWRGDGGAGPLNGPRTNLRASKESPIDAHGFAEVVRHWCVIFDIVA